MRFTAVATFVGYKYIIFYTKPYKTFYIGRFIRKTKHKILGLYHQPSVTLQFNAKVTLKMNQYSICISTQEGQNKIK